MSRSARCFCCYIVFTACLAVHAGEQANKRDPKVQAILDQMMTAYKSVNAIHLKATMKVTGVVPPEIVDGMPENVEFRFQRPNKIWLDSTEKRGEIAKRYLIVSDGKNLWQWETGMKTFTISKAPGDIKKMTGMPDSLPEFEVLFNEKNPFEDMPPESMVIPDKQNDVDVDALEIKNENTPADPMVNTAGMRIMIGQKDHLMRGITLFGKGKNPRTGKDIDFKCEFIYTLVNVAPTFTPADFVFTAPPGITEP